MATVNKNFRIKQGLIVEGTTGTINGQNILTETGADNYILNLVGGATLVKSVEATQLEVNGAGKLSVKSGVFDPAGSAAAAQSAAEATAASDATSKANAAQSAAITAAATDATNKANTALSSAQSFATNAANSAQSAAAADATNKADAAQTAAESFATTAANNAQSAAITAAASDATSKADAAKAAAEATAAAALSTAISTEVTNRNTAISTAVDSLVDGAPALLNTLNELAAAINDDANYTTTLTSALATKANSSDVTANIATAVSTASADATSKANAAQAAAEATASADATSKANAAQAAAEATAQAALDDVLDGTTPFTDLNINDVAKQVAARVTSLGSVVVTAYQFNKSAFKSGKFLVKIDNGTHNEISEILVTLDSSGNVAITEYAIVGTNGSRGTITADVDATHCRIRVNPVNDSTITVSGTVFNA